MDRKIGIGIIGTGTISNFHINGYLKTGRVLPVAVYDVNKERAKKFAEKYGFRHVCDSIEEFLSISDVEAVSVCSSNKSHALMSIAVLDARKHVLCEKPPAFELREMFDVQKAVKRSNKLYMPGFARRFLQKVVILKSFIDSGKLGDIFFSDVYLRRRVGNPGGWFANKALSGGGPTVDLGVHIIDSARYLMGRPKVVSVSAATFSKIGIRDNIKMFYRYKSADYNSYCDVEDSSFAFIRFDNGSVLQCKCSFSEHIKEETTNIEMQGSKGGAVFEPQLEIYTEENDYLTNIIPVYTYNGNDLQYSIDQEIDHFIKCVNGDEKCISTVEDAIEIMRILDALYKSAKIGHEVVI